LKNASGTHQDVPFQRVEKCQRDTSGRPLSENNNADDLHSNEQRWSEVSAMRRFILLVVLCGEARFLMAACTASGEAWPWNRFLHSVCFNSAVHKNVFLSPDKAKRIEVEEGKGFSLIVNGRTIAWPNYGKYVVLPIEFSWSPNSDAFFVNDGEGSGMNSVLHVFRLQDSGVGEEPNFNKLVAAAFRKDVGCSATAADPIVRGIGWSKDGAQILAFAQATVSNSCGTQGTFRGVILNLKTGSIERLDSEADARRVLHVLLPYNMR
jgi:hypothetical protein